MNKKILLFDINDLLINTFETAYRRNVYCLRKLNAPIISKDNFQKTFGKLDFETLIENWVGEENKDLFNSYYSEARNIYKYKSLLRDTNLLSQLVEAGILLGIISATSQKQLHIKFAEAKFPLDIFDVVYCGVNKESSYIIKQILHDSDISKDSTYYIGDQLSDYNFSIKGGIHFLAVTSGLYQKEDFVRAGCPENRIFSSIDELLIGVYNEHRNTRNEKKIL